MSEFHAEEPREIASEGLAQGPYVAARAGFEPVTIQTKGAESTNEPTSPTFIIDGIPSTRGIARNKFEGFDLGWVCIEFGLFYLTA